MSRVRYMSGTVSSDVKTIFLALNAAVDFFGNWFLVIYIYLYMSCFIALMVGFIDRYEKLL